MRVAIAAFAILAAIDPAKAATLMSMTLADGTPVVAISGLIADGDKEAFDLEMTTKPTPRALLLDSTGGDAIVAMQIGSEARNLKTIVPSGSPYQSACALIWLAGKPRVRETGAEIGFHALYVTKNGIKTVSAPGNALVEAYFAQLGLNAQAIVHLTEAGVDKVQPLLPEDRTRYGITYDDAPPE